MPGPSQAGQANANSRAVAIADALFICWGEFNPPRLLDPNADRAFQNGRHCTLVVDGSADHGCEDMRPNAC